MTLPSLGATPTSAELAALSTLIFEQPDAAGILDDAGPAVLRLGPCRTEATYHLVDGAWQRCPKGQHERPDIDQLVAESRGSGPVRMPGREWGWAFPLQHQDRVEGSLVVSATERPSSGHIQLLMALANQAGAALACLAHHQRRERCTEELVKATTDLAGARRRLRSRTHVHETIEAALGGGDGEQAGCCWLLSSALRTACGLRPRTYGSQRNRFGTTKCPAAPPTDSAQSLPEPCRPIPDPSSTQSAVTGVGQRGSRMPTDLQSGGAITHKLNGVHQRITRCTFSFAAPPSCAIHGPSIDGSMMPFSSHV